MKQSPKKLTEEELLSERFFDVFCEKHLNPPARKRRSQPRKHQTKWARSHQPLWIKAYFLSFVSFEFPTSNLIAQITTPDKINNNI